MRLDKNRGVCVQVGIGFSAEYSFLADPNWHEVIEKMDNKYHFPIEISSFVSDQPWLYYGIDCDPHSIIHAAEKYPDVENWLVTNIVAESKGIKRVQESWSLEAELSPTMITPIMIPCMTLADALKKLEIKFIDILAMDVEGDEAPILESYDFQIKPRFITVEIHVWPPFENHRSRIIDCLVSNGYTLAKEFKTNEQMDIPTIEAQFILKE